MKEFKYYLLCGISLIAFIYVVIFMPSIPLLEDTSNELWFSDAESTTQFYESGIQGLEQIKDKYNGNVTFKDLQMQLNISIGALQSLNSIYGDTENVYNSNKVYFYENFGIDSYIEYAMLCDSMKEIFNKNMNDRVLSARIVNDTLIDNSNGLIFETQILYTSGNIQTLIVTFYFDEQQPLEGATDSNVFPTILKILPKVEE